MSLPSNDPGEQSLEPPGLVFLDAAADARWSTPDQLATGVDLLKSIADDPEADPFEIYNAQERRRAYEQELARRDRVGRITSGTATRLDDDHVAWTRLAEIVKERVSVPEVLTLAGLVLTKTGTNRRSGASEFHSACPTCRDGVDRLVSWGGPHGRVWCRRCGWSTDVIGAASLIVKTGNFRDCVRFLAEHAGLAVSR